jgi:protein-S-isoprenylcysteine O-methyltransferase Ste14
MPAAIVVDAALLLAFFVPHSVMARQRFKDAVFAACPAPVERSTYVLVASLTIAAIIAFWRPIPSLLWDVEGTPLGAALRTISIAGWALSLAGSFSQGHRTLFGLKPAWDYFRGRPPEPARLHTSWLYRRLRHPMDLGFLIGVAVAPRMSAGHVLLTALFAAYVAIGVRYEERDLASRHGSAYAAYRKDVPWFGFSVRRR